MIDLEEIRRNSRIHLDRQGRFHHAGEAVEHPGVHRALCQGLAIREDGEVTLQIGEQWCYLTVEEPPQFVVSVRAAEAGSPHPGAWELTLLNGDVERLDPGTLFHVGDEDLYCMTTEGRACARFLRDAYHRLAEHLQEAPDGEGIALVLGERIVPIRREDERPRHALLSAAG